MPDIITRMENMLFQYETTNRTDFRYGDLKASTANLYRKKKHVQTTTQPLKDVHTLSNWKNTAIPFNLLHKPRPIVDTDPRVIPVPCEKIEDQGREEAQKTRPRLVMAPAVSLDDIEDPTTRAVLCNDMYRSAMNRTWGGVASLPSIKAPLPSRPSASNPIFLPKLNEPYVSPEWRMDSVSWDSKQLRGYCDQTKEFWMRRPPSKCRKCDESTTVKAHKIMLERVQQI